MCTQELVWCSCGHGEYLPIETCPQASAVGVCWIVVHGDHRVVLPGKCSYCLAGLNDKKPLLSPRPRDWLAQKIERNAEPKIDPVLLQDHSKQSTSTDIALLQCTSASLGNDPALSRPSNQGQAHDNEIEDSLPAMDTFGFNDVLSTDFRKDFNLSEELWQYH